MRRPLFLTRTGGKLLPETLEWQARAVANGGAGESAAGLQIVDGFWRRVNAAGFSRASFGLLNIGMGLDLASYLTQDVYPAGYGMASNTNFVAGDYNRQVGLVGNGTSKYLDTGHLPGAVGLMGAKVAGTYAHTTATTLMGALGGGGGLYALSPGTSPPGVPRGIWGMSSVIATDTGQILTNQGYMVARYGGTDLRLYRNGAQVATTATSSAAGAGDRSLYVFCRNNNGSPSSFVPSGVAVQSYFAVPDPSLYTAAQIQALADAFAYVADGRAAP